MTSLNILTNPNRKLDVSSLTASLMRYAQSEDFAPSAQVPEAEFVRLFSPRPEPKPPAEAQQKKDKQ